MIAAFVKTESTGLFDPRAPGDAAHQPRMVRASCAVFDGRTEHACFDVLVTPEGFRIPDEATAIHGVRHQDATMLGVPVKIAVAMLTNLAKVASTLVMQSQFDDDLIQAELARFGRALDFSRPALRRVHLGQRAALLCKLPRMNGENADDYRTPTIAEAVKFLFDEDHTPHSGLADVRALERIFAEVDKRGLIS